MNNSKLYYITILIKTRESTLPEWTEREFVLIKGEERREIKQVILDLHIFKYQTKNCRTAWSCNG